MEKLYTENFSQVFFLVYIPSRLEFCFCSKDEKHGEKQKLIAFSSSCFSWLQFKKENRKYNIKYCNLTVASPSLLRFENTLQILRVCLVLPFPPTIYLRIDKKYKPTQQTKTNKQTKNTMKYTVIS